MRLQVLVPGVYELGGSVTPLHDDKYDVHVWANLVQADRQALVRAVTAQQWAVACAVCAYHYEYWWSRRNLEEASCGESLCAQIRDVAAMPCAEDFVKEVLCG